MTNRWPDDTPIGVLIEHARTQGGKSQCVLAERLREVSGNTSLSREYVSRWESGKRIPTPYWRAHLSVALDIPRDVLDRAAAVARTGRTSSHRDRVLSGEENESDTGSTTSSEPEQPMSVEKTHHIAAGLLDVLSEGTTARTNLDDWGQTIAGHGRATRDRPSGALVVDLSTDLEELWRMLSRPRPASTLRRLTRLTAQMAGLMCLTLIKLDERSAFRRWARTARAAAAEVEDPALHAWVLGQEAYGHYYNGELGEAVEVARRAQDIAGSVVCVGVPLAAALEARAEAVRGRREETRDALARAEDALARLGTDSLVASAFGYNEAQFRFHEGNAHTHLHDGRAASRAQDRALELCAPGDYTDWALTRLDRVGCLIDERDLSTAMGYATETLMALTDQQRKGIITRRGYEILASLTERQRALPTVRELRELLSSADVREGNS